MALQKRIRSTAAVMEQHRHELDIDTAARMALRDPTVGVSDLFRHCAAAHARDAVVAEQFEPSAVWRYVRRKWTYDQTWGHWIPAPLKAVYSRWAPGCVGDDR